MRISENYGPENWHLPPPIEGDWAEFDQSGAALLVARLSEAIRADAAAATTWVEAARALPLDFYEGWMLCDIQTLFVAARPDSLLEADTPVTAEPRRTVSSYLFGPDGFTPLDGASRQIHEHNMKHGIDVSTVEKAKSYLRFFCFFVRADMGPFEIHETGARLDLKDISDADALQKATKALSPLGESDPPSGSQFERSFRACVLYGDHLFESQFGIASYGHVEMLNDDLIVGGVHRTPELGFDGNRRFAAKVSGTAAGAGQ